MARYIRPGRVHPASRAWTVAETKIPHRPNSAISHRRESFPRNLIVNPAYKQPHYDPLDSATEEDMVPTVMESPQNNTVPRRVTKRENINLVRQTEWDVKGTKTESLVQRNTLSKPVSVLLGLVCFTSCLSLILTLLILSGSIEAGRCSCGDNEGPGRKSAITADEKQSEKFSTKLSSLNQKMAEMTRNVSELPKKIENLETMLLGHNASKLHEEVSSQNNSIKHLTKRLDSIQAQTVGHAAVLEDLNSSTTTNMMEFKQVWTVFNTTKQEKDNLTKKVDQEFKRIRQDVKQTEGSLLNKTNSSLQDFENKVNSEIRIVSLKLNTTIARSDYLYSSLKSQRKNVRNSFGKLELRVKMEEEKSSNITKSLDHHSKLIQHLTDMLNDTREDMRNMSREQSTALELAQNSTVAELLRVRMLVDSTQTILLTQLKKMHENMTKKVTKETEKLETRIEIEENKSNSTKQVTDQHLNRIQQIEKLLNVTRENMKEESKKYFTALWLTGNSTKMDLQSIRMVLNVTRGNIVRQLKEVQDNLTEQVKNVSKMPGPIGPPGYNGSQGPVGPQGAVGPAGPKGSGDFGQCQYDTKEENKITGSDRILVHIDEPANKRVMAVTCSTDHSAEYNLVTRTQGANVRRFVCTCDGISSLFNRGTKCYLHYWICPLTT
nr:collectin-12-like [Pocillopora verrucosa]